MIPMNGESLEIRMEVIVEVERYVLDHPGSDSFDISVGLLLPFGMIKEACARLVSEGGRC